MIRQCGVDVGLPFPSGDVQLLSDAGHDDVQLMDYGVGVRRRRRRVRHLRAHGVQKHPAGGLHRTLPLGVDGPRLKRAALARVNGGGRVVPRDHRDPGPADPLGPSLGVVD